MNIYNPPVRIPNPVQDRWAEADAESDAVFEHLNSGRFDRERLGAWKKFEKIAAERDEILRRTGRIVNRLCPAVRTPDVAWTAEGFAAYAASLDRRRALHRLITPRIEAKVRFQRTTRGGI